MHLDTWTRSDDRERAIAVGPNGDVYAGISADDPEDATLRVYAAADRSVVADTIGAWNVGPSDIEFGPAGNLWAQIPGRFIGDPQNPQFQANQLDVYDPVSGLELDSFVRPDDRNRFLAVGPTGTLFNGASLLNNEATIRVYPSADPGATPTTVGTWKAGARSITSTFVVPEPAIAGAIAALVALVGVARGRASRARSQR